MAETALSPNTNCDGTLSHRTKEIRHDKAAWPRRPSSRQEWLNQQEARQLERITELRPQLVTYNGTSFDLPVLRYRAMVNRVSAPGLHAWDYFRRYTDDAIDLCDVLSSFDARSKISLNDLCRILGLAGKPDSMDGSQVERYVNEGRIDEVSSYCETDVVNTYRVFLIHELFAGRLTHATYEASEDDLRKYLKTRTSVKAHYSSLIEPR